MNDHPVLRSALIIYYLKVVKPKNIRVTCLLLVMVNYIRKSYFQMYIKKLQFSMSGRGVTQELNHQTLPTTTTAAAATTDYYYYYPPISSPLPYQY